MLALEPLRSCKDEDEHQMGSFSMGEDDFTAGNLLDDIDFDDLFAGIDYGDVLPDLEIDPDMLAEFSLSGGEEYSSELNNGSVVSSDTKPALLEETSNGCKIGDEYLGYNSGSGLSSSTSSGGGGGEEIVSKREDDESGGGVLVDNKAAVAKDSTIKEANKGRKSSSTTSNQSKGGSHGNNKRKVKVDWTPELHRRFVQAVEQLGMDKAVPSRILELMGIDCLTRHNIASHLQKYRSHQKHLLAREAEAASWSQRRQIYGGTGRSSSSKREVICNTSTTSTTTPWIAPTMGFPPPPPPPPAPTPPPPPPHPNLLHHHPLRPLHVWGHPTAAMDQTAASFPQHIWPKHLLHHSPSPPPRWAAPPHHPPPPTDPSFWHHHHQRVSANLVTAGTPCFTAHQRLATSSLQRNTGVPQHHPVPGVPPPHHAMYKLDRGMGAVPAPNGPHSGSHPPFHLHPSKECIDAAIGDVLSKPWLPLPLGLKPPALDSVMVELHRQGVPEIPPTGTASTSTNTACA